MWNFPLRTVTMLLKMQGNNSTSLNHSHTLNSGGRKKKNLKSFVELEVGWFKGSLLVCWTCMNKQYNLTWKKKKSTLTHSSAAAVIINSLLFLFQDAYMLSISTSFRHTWYCSSLYQTSPPLLHKISEFSHLLRVIT